MEQNIGQGPYIGEHYPVVICTVMEHHTLHVGYPTNYPLFYAKHIIVKVQHIYIYVCKIEAIQLSLDVYNLNTSI